VSPLDHYPEPFSPTGSMASEGVLNQLGRPRMGPLEVLIREAVQNCWDAKADDSEQVRVGIHLMELDESQRASLSDQFFYHGPPTEGGGEGLREGRRLLLISDRGTTGLGGGLRADRVDGDEPKDFVDFVRNVGQPPDKDRGGGTYGYGKVALYLASRHRTLIIHSRCSYKGRDQARLIAARLGQQYAHAGQRFTGRHWWGRLKDDDAIDPVLDAEAGDLAETIGLPAFEGSERGSTIAILEPDFGQVDDQRAMELIGQAVAWNFWPKMVALEDSDPPMDFQLTALGTPVSVPDPSSHPLLRGFCDAYRRLKAVARSGTHVSEPGAKTQDIACGRPIKDLGILSLAKLPLLGSPGDPETPEDEPSEHPAPGIEGDAIHHTALLRSPELVVRYVAGPESPTPGIGYAGVFLAHDHMDRIYAQSEPPTHDDWVPDGVSDPHHRTFVRVTIRRLDDAMRKFAGIVPAAPTTSEGTSLGALAERLSGLLPGVAGPGARVPETEAGPGRPGPTAPGRARPQVTLDGGPVLEMIDGKAAVTVTGKVRVPEAAGPVVVRAKPYVVLESGAPEREAPAGAETPQVLGWRDKEGSPLGDGADHIRLEGEGEHIFLVSATVPLDTHVGIEVTGSSEQG
jgi:hypothetical protein